MTLLWSLSIDGNIAAHRQVTALASSMSRVLNGDKAPPSAHLTAAWPGDATRLPNNSLLTWRNPVPESAFPDIICREGRIQPPWPDILVACRPEVAGLALGIKHASQGRTRLVHIQSPNDIHGHYAFDTDDFDLVIRQPQETLVGANIIDSDLALHGLTPQHLNSFARPDLKHDGLPWLGVLVGGTDEYLSITPAMIAALADDLQRLAEGGGFHTYILTSRRTGAEQAAVLKTLETAGRRIHVDDPSVSYMTALATCDALLVTADSLSMASEALISGKPVFTYDFGGYLKAHPIRPALERCRASGHLPLFSPGRNLFTAPPAPFADELPRLSERVCRQLGLTRSARNDVVVGVIDNEGLRQTVVAN